MKNALMHMFRFNVWFVLFVLFCFSYDLYSGSDHYKNILIGDRAATMGGAFTAISDDASGVYYNPAGLVYVPHSSFTGSANTFRSTDIIYENAVIIDDWVRESRSVRPNFFSMVNKLSDDLAWAVSYIIPDATIEHQQEIFYSITPSYNTYILNYHDEDTTTYVGPSLSYRMSNSLSIGLSYYYFFRDHKIQTNQYLSDEFDNISQWQSIDQMISINGSLLIFGLMWAPFDKFSFGFSARQFSLESSTMDQNVIDYLPDYSDVPEITSETVDYSIDYPTQLSVGMAYFPSPFLIFSADADFHYFSDSSVSLDNVLNFSAGVEYFINPKQAFRLGVFTNNSNVPKPSSSTTDLRSIDMIGASVGYSLYGPSNTMTLGVVYSYGEGGAQIYSGDSTIIDFNQTDLTVLLSAGFGL